MTESLSAADKTAEHSSSIDGLRNTFDILWAYLQGVGFTHEEQRQIAMTMCLDVGSSLAKVQRHLRSEDKSGEVSDVGDLREENKLLRALVRRLLHPR